MKYDRKKIGFIGGGLNSAIGETHKIASQMDGKFELSSGCFSRNRDINLKTAQRWGVERFYTDYKTFLEAEKDLLDAVVVLTPTNAHTQIILEALELGIPVISEKTLTASVADALKIRRKLEERGGFLLTTYNYTGYPMVRELRQMIADGRLGKVVQINIRMPQESFIRLEKDGSVPKPQNWRLKDYGISTLSLDLGTHLSNMVSFLTGARPEEAVAMQNRFGHYDVVDNMVGLVRYSGGIDCHMWYSKSALGHKNGLKVEVYGTEGAAEWYQMNPEFLAYSDNVGRNIILDRSSKEVTVAEAARYNRFKSGHPAGFIEAFANHYDDIHDSLSAYGSGGAYDENIYVFGIGDSLSGLRLMETMERSVRSGKWEAVDAQD